MGATVRVGSVAGGELCPGNGANVLASTMTITSSSGRDDRAATVQCIH